MYIHPDPFQSEKPNVENAHSTLSSLTTVAKLFYASALRDFVKVLVTVWYERLLCFKQECPKAVLSSFTQTNPLQDLMGFVCL
jgi:hypothetical protein